MDQPREYLPLGAEASRELAGVHAGANELDGHLLLIMRVVSLGEIDVAHATPAEVPHQTMGADVRAE